MGEGAELALKLNDTRKQLKNVSKNEDDLKSQFTKLQAGITRREASARVTVESEQNASEIYEDLLASSMMTLKALSCESHTMKVL